MVKQLRVIYSVVKRPIIIALALALAMKVAV